MVHNVNNDANVTLCFLFQIGVILTMRKFRYAKVVSVSPWRKGLTFVYFFVGWNTIGYVVYKLLSQRYSKKKPGFEQMSGTDKYLTMMGYKKEDLTDVTVRPFGPKELKKKSNEQEAESE